DSFRGLTVLCRKCQQKIMVPESSQATGRGDEMANFPHAKPSAGPLPSWLEMEPSSESVEPAGKAREKGAQASEEETSLHPPTPPARGMSWKTMMTLGGAALVLIGVMITVFFLLPGKQGSARTLEELCRELKEGDDAGRRNASVELGNRGSESAAALADMLAALQDPVAEVRAAA